ncbi:hypothetical protein Syun_013989 [Stephania yunnanensis]|uniref:beta-galactosidase n=1 Tax=Stephania yunnanensis TaxID=152371 RepID=A0AAP0JIW6_9MAGN
METEVYEAEFVILCVGRGFPIWLHFIPGIELRTDNEPFKKEMQKFTAKIVDMMKQEKLYASQGGTIILSQLRIGTSFYGTGEVSGQLEWTGKRVSYFLPNGVALGVLAATTRRCEIDLCKESNIKIVAPASYPIITFGPLPSPTAVLVSLSHAIGYLLELVLFLLVRWDDMLMKAAGKDCTFGAVSLLGFSAIFSAILLAQESIYGQMVAYMKESGEGFLTLLSLDCSGFVKLLPLDLRDVSFCENVERICSGRYLALYLVQDRLEGTL